mgnify:FL=1
MATSKKNVNVTSTSVEAKKPIVTHVYKSQKGIIVGRSKGQKAVAEARDFVEESLEQLKNKIKSAFDKNILDHDLIFEEVIAAGVEIVDIAEVTIDGKVFRNISITNHIIGDKQFFMDMVDAGEIIDTCPEM